MQVALVGPELEENLSLRYLASSLTAAGLAVEIVAFDHDSELPRVAERLLRGKPALIGLSLAFQRRAADFFALAVELRRRGYSGHITGGGHFGTFTSAEILRDFPEIDSICRHEAENTIVRLAAGDDLTSIPGLAYRSRDGSAVFTDLSQPPDLRTLPWPDRGGEPAQCLGHRIAPLISSRGCYGHCAFCSIAAWHEQATPGRRYRLRPIEDVAGEMASLYHERGIEVFIFHDDNFFLPRPAQSLRRIEALAGELERRGVRRFATVVKARPNDLNPAVIAAMQERLGLIRLYVGIENASKRGLETLERAVGATQNLHALEMLEERGIFACFNLLMFEPSACIEDLQANLDFMERFAAIPHNFGRVELYAGTPLLARMQAEGRATGDYLEWDYRIADDSVQRVFELAMQCLYHRNFSEEATPHVLMGARFLVEMAARFHPDIFRPQWLEESKRLSRMLTRDSVGTLRAIIEHAGEPEFIASLAARCRAAEQHIHAAARRLEQEIEGAICPAFANALSPISTT